MGNCVEIEETTGSEEGSNLAAKEARLRETEKEFVAHKLRLTKRIPMDVIEKFCGMVKKKGPMVSRGCVRFIDF